MVTGDTDAPSEQWFGETPEIAAPLSRDQIFELLTNSRRRKILRYLDANEGRGHLEDIAARIAAVEDGIQLDSVSDERQRTIYISLYQHHCPKMFEAGVIDYDRDEGAVTLQDTASVLLPYIYFDPTAEDERRGGIVASVKSWLGFD